MIRKYHKHYKQDKYNNVADSDKKYEHYLIFAYLGFRILYPIF
jgi:hypothetical protein